MSVLVLQIGQCGNQIGYKVFSNLIEGMKNSSECLAQIIGDSYFTIDSKDNLYANSILIDMEAKVIDRCLKSSNEKGWNYYKENIIHKQSGSGNNWANGFFNHGPTIENDLIEIVHSMSEKFDYVDSILLINSLAGGTGSGLGSYVNIILKDYLPTTNLLNASIFPHNAGEVIVNSYNTLFSLSESYKVSDMMSIINNQEIFDICREIYKDKKIGFENLNHIISKHLISALIPCLGNSQKTKMAPFTSKSFISEIIRELGSEPRLKFMRIISTPEMPDIHIPFTNNNWYSLIKRGYHMLINGSNESKIDWSTKQTVKIQSAIQIYRGKGFHELTELKENKNNLLYNLGMDNPQIKLTEQMDINEFNKYDKHLTILNNSNFLDDRLKQNLNKAMDMYEYSAFIHQYEKYGMENSDFLDAFAFCEQIRYDYNNYI